VPEFTNRQPAARDPDTVSVYSITPAAATQDPVAPARRRRVPVWRKKRCPGRT